MVPILEIDPTIGSTASTSILWSTGDTTNTINVSPTSTTKYWVRKTIDSDTIIDTITVHVLDPTINATSTTVCSASDSVMLWINSDSTSTPSACGDLPSGLNNGLVAWYPFCGNANDGSSIGNNGTVYGATLTTDRNGNPNSAYEFNGSSYIEAQNNAALNFTSSHTYSVWVRITGSNTWQHFITRNDGASHPLLQQFYLRRGSGGSIELQNSPNGNIVHTTNTLNSTNPQWHHIAAVVDVNALKSYLYLDGVMVDSSSLSTPLNYNNNNGKLWIGVENPIVSLPSGPQYLQGKLDDIGIWNRALTQSEITQLYSGANISSTLWSTGEATDTIWINPTTDTTIWVSSSLGNVTCIDSIDIEFLNPQIQSNTMGVCAPGDTAMLWVENESNAITWSTGETSDTIYVTPTLATNYWVQFTSFNGVCSDTIEIDVSEPIEIFGDSLLCEGDSVQLYVVTSNYSIQNDTLYFNDFENTIGSEWSSTNSLSFNGSTNLGNFGNQNLVLSLSNLPQDSLQIDFDLWIHDTWDGNQSGVIYQSDFWTFAIGSDTLLHTTFSNWSSYNQSYPGNYPSSYAAQYGSVLTTSSLCSAQGSSLYHLSFTIDNSITNTDFILNGSPSQSLCDESWSIDNVIITAKNGTMSNGVAWSTGETTDSIWVKPTQTTTYWASSTDQYGCESTDSITVFVSDIQNSISTQEPSCNGSSDGQAQVNPTGGVSPYTFLWSNGSGSSIANNLSSGTVWVAVTDSIGCSAVDTFFLDQPDSLLITSILTSSYNGYNVSCNGGSDGNVNTTVAGGTMPYYYNWNNNTYTTSGISNVSAGTYILQVTDTNGCMVSQTVLLSEPNPIIISPSITSNFNGYAVSCYGESDGSADANISGGISPYTILWSNGTPTSSMTNVPSGSYSVMITDGNGCIDSTQIYLSQPNPLSATAIVTDASCYGERNGRIELSLSGGAGSFNINWNTGDTGITIDNIPSDWYSYNVISSNNCSYEDSIFLDHPMPLSIELDTIHPTCINSFDGELNLVAMGGTPGYNYFLNGNAFTGSIQGLGTDSLRILAVDFNNCDTLFVIAMPPVRDPCIFIPNWFSPNGNSEEDTWLIDGFEYGALTLKIFNVLGQELYKTESANYIPWDGTFSGKSLPAGDYYYVITSALLNNNYTGYVTLLR
jgi:gliding motility-associated-like protein